MYSTSISIPLLTWFGLFLEYSHPGREWVTFLLYPYIFYWWLQNDYCCLCTCAVTVFIQYYQTNINPYIYVQYTSLPHHYHSPPHAHIQPIQIRWFFLLVFSSLGIFECKNELNEDITFKGFFVLLFIRPIFTHPSMLHGYILRQNTIQYISSFPLLVVVTHLMTFFLYPFQSSRRPRKCDLTLWIERKYHRNEKGDPSKKYQVQVVAEAEAKIHLKIYWWLQKKGIELGSCSVALHSFRGNMMSIMVVYRIIYKYKYIGCLIILMMGRKLNFSSKLDLWSMTKKNPRKPHIFLNSPPCDIKLCIYMMLTLKEDNDDEH